MPDFQSNLIHFHFFSINGKFSVVKVKSLGEILDSSFSFPTPNPSRLIDLTFKREPESDTTVSSTPIQTAFISHLNYGRSPCFHLPPLQSIPNRVGSDPVKGQGSSWHFSAPTSLRIKGKVCTVASQAFHNLALTTWPHLLLSPCSVQFSHKGLHAIPGTKWACSHCVVSFTCCSPCLEGFSPRTHMGHSHVLSKALWSP